MRGAIAIAWMLILATGAGAAQLDTRARITKPAKPMGQMQACAPAGEKDPDAALPILELPFSATGSTCGQTNDYDLDCPAPGASSPDVLYTYTPESDGYLRVDLCGSDFDTKLIVFFAEPGDGECNDDAYYDEDCGRYTSLVPGVAVQAGEPVYIVVDGYGGACGDFRLTVTESGIPPFCSIACVGEEEGEPVPADGYVDATNGGCNSPSEGYPLQDLEGDLLGEFLLCGESGWYDVAARDTDWFIGIFGQDGTIRLTLDAEQWIRALALSPLDCAGAATVAEIMAGPCSPASFEIQGSPGQLAWFWIAPVEFVPPAGFEGPSFDYTASFEGLQAKGVSSDSISWDGVKSLYR